MINSENVMVDVAWDGQIAGSVVIRGSDPDDWGWVSKRNLASRVIENQPGQLPNFLKYLTVEGELAKILNSDAEHPQLIKKGLRFLCNLRMGITEDSLLSIVADEHEHHLKDYTEDGGFTGELVIPSSCMNGDNTTCSLPESTDLNQALSESFACAVKKSYDSVLTPKFSGFQLKMPMTLALNPQSGKPELSTAKETPFTHILKFGSSHHMLETIPIAEWVGLELSEASGLKTCDHALIKLPQDYDYGSGVFGLVVERFDIRDAGDNPNIGYFMADMCSVAGVHPTPKDDKTPGKYNTPVEQMIYAALHNSSDPAEDTPALFRRVVFGYLLADMDMHLKNVSMLSTVDKGKGEIKVRMAPTYDAVPTRVFPDQEYKVMDIEKGGNRVIYEPDDSFSLPINGKYKDITEDDFMALADAIGLDTGEAMDIIFDVAPKIIERAIEIAKNPPETLKDHMNARFVLWRIASEVADQVKDLTGMEFHDDLDNNYYTYKDYDVFCEKFKNQGISQENDL